MKARDGRKSKENNIQVQDKVRPRQGQKCFFDLLIRKTILYSKNYYIAGMSDYLYSTLIVLS